MSIFKDDSSNLSNTDRIQASWGWKHVAPKVSDIPFIKESPNELYEAKK